MVSTTIEKLKVQSVLFVGGKQRNLPDFGPSVLHVHQWEQDSSHKGSGYYFTPHPVPDVVILYIPHASHALIDKGKAFAKGLHIPCISITGGKSQIIQRFSEKGVDVSEMFEHPEEQKQEEPKMGKAEPKRKMAKKILGSFKEKIVEIARKNNLYNYPLSEIDGLQLKNLVNIELNESVAVTSLQRMMRIESKSIAKTPKRTITAPVEQKTEEKPIEKPRLEFENTMPGIFKKIFDLHEQNIALLQENAMYSQEIDKLTTENKSLRERNEKLLKIEQLFEKKD